MNNTSTSKLLIAVGILIALVSLPTITYSQQVIYESGKLHQLGDNEFGYSIASGDWNGDGNLDLAISSPMSELNTGRVYYYHGNSNGLFNQVRYQSFYASSSRYGYSMTAGDIDQDGYDDIMVGVPF